MHFSIYKGEGMTHRNFTLFCVIVLSASVVFFLWVYHLSVDKRQSITCNARYDFFMGKHSINSSLTIENTKNQGSILIRGDYYVKNELTKPFSILNSYSIDRKNNIYSAKMQNSFTNPKALLNDSNFAAMMGGVILSENALSVYHILSYGDENYVFMNQGMPLFVCQTMK